MLACSSSAFAIETCCCLAIESAPSGWDERRAVEADGVEQLEHAGRLGAPVDWGRVVISRPTKKFSATVSSGKSCGSW